MGRPGFEPGTNRLKAEYSTVELATLINLVLSHTVIKISIVITNFAILFSKKIYAWPKTKKKPGLLLLNLRKDYKNVAVSCTSI